VSRAPIAYALGRPLEGEAGGAADLQTDIMRFMAILALCLMAIFALVQSLPDAPVTAENANDETPPAELEVATAEPVEASPQPGADPAPKPVTLTRATAKSSAPQPKPVQLTRRQSAPPKPAAKPAASETAAPEPEQEGFTLRFESDLALSRLVATGQVGFFALDDKGAQRMSVAANDVSFWAAPVPARFHEMDEATVPVAVRRALRRTGRADSVTSWAVTLPARLSGDLERIMQAHKGGALVIAKDGSLRREAS
jgi:outer membrane biosynthesis protein TonB